MLKLPKTVPLISIASLIGIVMKAIANKYNEIKYILVPNDENRTQKEDIRLIVKMRLGPLQGKKANIYCYSDEATSRMANFLSMLSQ